MKKKRILLPKKSGFGAVEFILLLLVLIVLVILFRDHIIRAVNSIAGWMTETFHSMLIMPADHMRGGKV